MHIAFVIPYPLKKVASQRFRFVHYLDILESNGYTYSIYSFLSDRHFSIIYKKGFTVQKITAVFFGYFRRLVQLFHIIKADYVFIHREASPFGFPLFAWLIRKVFRKKIVYDFDDAIWLQDKTVGNKLINKLKFSGKVSKICKWSHIVSVGNDFLAKYAEEYNSNVVVIPTVVDTCNYHSIVKQHSANSATIGWTGSHSTTRYLNEILPELRKLNHECHFAFHVISNKKPNFELNNMVFIPWTEETEIKDILAFDIGIMPLTEDLWSKGKCGFKAIQYMSLAIPAVVSNVGVNREIVEDGVNGFVCVSKSDWFNNLKTLLEDHHLRQNLGDAARKKIIKNYSVQATQKAFLSLFNS